MPCDCFQLLMMLYQTGWFEHSWDSHRMVQKKQVKAEQPDWFKLMRELGHSITASRKAP